MKRVASLALCLASLAACASSHEVADPIEEVQPLTTDLSVLLSTDYLPGVELGRVIVQLGHGEIDTRVPLQVLRVTEINLTTDDSFSEEREVAMFDALPQGDYFIEVQLFDVAGNRVASRRARFELDGLAYSLHLTIPYECQVLSCETELSRHRTEACAPGFCDEPAHANAAY